VSPQNESEESSYENAAKKVFVIAFEEKCVIPNFLETMDDDSLICPFVCWGGGGESV
jgi:hypothetical protein